MRKAGKSQVRRFLGCAPEAAGYGIRLLSIVIVLAFSFLLLPFAAAQLYTGSISGTVNDPSGAVIPSARVNATDQDKGFAFAATTDASGRYLLRQIPPGTYNVVVEAPNFQSQRKEAIKVDVNQNVTVDFSMKVGAAAQMVEVQASGVELQTQDAVTGQVVNRNLINNLPLINRSVFDLAFLAPGTAVPDHQCDGCTATNFISNGSRNATADVLMDGVSTSNFEQNSGVLSQAYVPSVDAVEEFTVQQSNFSAEYGFSGSTIVNLVTRSGTNNFHGSLYEFLRNDKLDANNWFSNHNGKARAPLRHNNFGVTFGGPIQKDKTFFFFDYDGTRSRNFRSASYGVATDLEKQGDFSQLCALRGASFDASGLCTDAAGQLWDPFKGASFDLVNSVPTRTIFIKNNNLAAGALSDGSTDATLIDPVAQKLMALFPEPTKSIATTDDLLNNFFRSGTEQQSNNQFDIKIDHRFSDRSLLSAKYSQLWAHFHGFNAFGNIADNFSSGPRDDTAHLFALNETFTFGPTLVLNVSYGFTRGYEINHGLLGDFPNLDPVTLLGAPSYMNVSGYKQLPNVILDNYQTSGDANIGTQTFSYWKQGSDSHHLLGTLSWVHGSHELKFGGEGRLHRVNFGQPGYPGGQFEFDNTGTSGVDPGTGGDSMASFLMGVGPATGCQNGACQYEVPNFVSTQNFQFGGFVQDNYRVTPKLTLNLGLRYDVSLPRTERFNRQNSLDLTKTNPLNGGSVTYTDPLTGQNVTRALLGIEVFASPKNRANFGTDWKDIQPRFGFAYQLPHTFVLRGGYGIFYSTPRSGAAGTGPVDMYKGYDQFTNWVPVDPTDQFTPVGRFSNPFPNGGPILPPGNTLGPLNDVGFGGGGAIKAITNTPYEQSWSFGFEKELPWKMILDTSYIGKKGTHLYFSGAGDVNHLGPFVDKLTPSERGALGTPDLANPFFGVITDPNSTLSGTCSSVDPWHEPSNISEKRDQVGFDLFYTSGYTRGLPAMIPIAMLYGTPEDSAAQVTYLKARGYPISYIEMGEEPDGQFMLPEQYGALYLQWATALHRVDPSLKLGGPIFQGVNEDIQVWPDAQGKTSWLGRFIDYLKAHGRIGDLAFASFEHYPLEPCKIQWSSLYDEPTLISHILQVWRDDGLPRNVPIFISELNIAWNTGESFVDIFGGLWLADYVGSFLSAGGDGLYYFHYLPVGLYHGCNGSMGTFALFTVDSNYQIQQPTSQFFASQLINLEWAQPGTGEHQIFPAESDISDPAGHVLVTAYPVLRPDGQWSVMLVNKDQENSHSVRIAFHEDRAGADSFFTGPVNLISFGSEQYQWHPDDRGGKADPDGPAVRSTVTAAADTEFTLPKASVTVIRGKVAAKPSAPAKRTR